MQEPKWYGAWEAAREIGVGIASLKRIPPKDLPYMRFGTRGDRRYRKEDVEAYIEQRMVRR